MVQNSEHWLDVAVRNPILTGFVGAGLFVSILMLTNDVRKRLFGDKPAPADDPESVTQELRAIRDEYRTLVRVQNIQIDNLQEDNTDLRAELDKYKTKPFPDGPERGANESPPR